MPELPEVETIACELQKKILGAQVSKIQIFNDSILSSPRAIFETRLPGKKIEAVSRRGKFLRLDIEEQSTLWIHLGMTGQLLWKEAGENASLHEHVKVEFSGRSQALVYRDIRKFGEIILTNGRPESLPGGIGRLGPEPWDLTEMEFVGLFKRRTGRIKSLLLNQRILAGLGNIYADESLHRAGIDPRRRPHRLNRPRLAGLQQAICGTLREAIRHGGSSIDDYLHTDGGRGEFQNFHRVYGREGQNCLLCGAAIRRIVLAGRSSFFCPKCQK